MVPEQTDNYIRAYLKSWILCECCSNVEMGSVSPRYDLVIKCNSCAEACFELVLQLMSKADDMGDLPFNCMLHCRQFIAECQKYPGAENLQTCIEACSSCVEAAKELADFAMN